MLRHSSASLLWQKNATLSLGVSNLLEVATDFVAALVADLLGGCGGGGGLFLAVTDLGVSTLRVVISNLGRKGVFTRTNWNAEFKVLEDLPFSVSRQEEKTIIRSIGRATPRPLEVEGPAREGIARKLKLGVKTMSFH
ncbi:hypothetical protein SLE2022_360200 [Rubroshorea leprosula]